MAKAVRRDPRDGRSWFLIAMMHLYRFGRMVEHWPDAGPDARAEVDAAHAAFEKAVRLSWDGTRGDTRVPGFAASAIFQKSFFGNDPAEIARGLALM